jgi:hypothetical protein
MQCLKGWLEAMHAAMLQQMHCALGLCITQLSAAVIEQ